MEATQANRNILDISHENAPCPGQMHFPRYLFSNRAPLVRAKRWTNNSRALFIPSGLSTTDLAKGDGKRGQTHFSRGRSKPGSIMLRKPIPLSRW